MSGTVEFGGWPRPPRWVWAVAGVATVAVLAGVLVARTGPHRPGPVPAVTSPADGNGGRQLAGLPMPPRKPARMAGWPLPRGDGLRLVLGGQRPAWLRVATGRAEPIRGLPHRGNGYQLIRVAGGWAALPFPATGGWCDNCAPRPGNRSAAAPPGHWGTPDSRGVGPAPPVRQAPVTHSAELGRTVSKMEFSKELREDVLSGEITVSFRLWRRLKVSPGRRYPVGPGWIEIDSIELVPFSSINADDVRRAGETDLEALRRRAAHAGPIDDGTLLYRIEFHAVP